MPELWKNWYGNESVSNVRVYRPRTLEQLKAAVVHAKSTYGPGIRVVGSGHSWSPLARDASALISTEHLTRVLSPPSNNSVTVESGISVKTLTQIVERRKFSLISPPLYWGMSVGGVAATGSAGHGREVSLFSDNITEFTIVDHDGNVQVITEADPKEIRALRVSLGLLGVVYSVKIRLEPSYNIRLEREKYGMERLTSEMRDLASSYHSAEIRQFPSSPWIRVRTHDRVDEPPHPRVPLWSTLELLSFYAGEVGAEIIRHLGERVTLVLPVALALSSRFADWGGTRIEESWRSQHYYRHYPKAMTIAFAIPVADAGEAWRELQRLIESYGLAGDYPINIAIYARFIQGSDAYLSPVKTGTRYCILEAVCTGETSRFPEFRRELQQKLFFDIAGARPHWAKYVDWHHPAVGSQPSFIDELQTRLGQDLVDFRDVRDNFDPLKVFVNPFTTQVLGL